MRTARPTTQPVTVPADGEPGGAEEPQLPGAGMTEDGFSVFGTLSGMLDEEVPAPRMTRSWRR